MQKRDAAAGPARREGRIDAQPGRRPEEAARTTRSPCKSRARRRQPAKPGSQGEGQRCAQPRKGGEDIAETNKAAVTRVTRKLLARTEELLDAEVLSSADLDKLSNVIKDAAAVLGVKSALDAREQRGKIAVLLRRAEGEDRKNEPVEILFAPDVEDAAK